jgi:hypothetical protein
MSLDDYIARHTTTKDKVIAIGTKLLIFGGIVLLLGWIILQWLEAGAEAQGKILPWVMGILVFFGVYSRLAAQ